MVQTYFSSFPHFTCTKQFHSFNDIQTYPLNSGIWKCRLSWVLYCIHKWQYFISLNGFHIVCVTLENCQSELSYISLHHSAWVNNNIEHKRSIIVNIHKTLTTSSSHTLPPSLLHLYGILPSCVIPGLSSFGLWYSLNGAVASVISGA